MKRLNGQANPDSFKQSAKFCYDRNDYPVQRPQTFFFDDGPDTAIDNVFTSLKRKQSRVQNYVSMRLTALVWKNMPYQTNFYTKNGQLVDTKLSNVGSENQQEIEYHDHTNQLRYNRVDYLY